MNTNQHQWLFMVESEREKSESATRKGWESRRQKRETLMVLRVEQMEKEKKTVVFDTMRNYLSIPESRGGKRARGDGRLDWSFFY